MTTVSTSASNPNPRKYVPAGQANRVRVEEAFLEASDRLEAYTQYMATPAGEASSRLADNQIEYLQQLLTMATLEFCRVQGISNDNTSTAEMVRAELRGELRTWKLIKREPARLERLLKHGKEDGAEGLGRQGWETRT